MIVRRYSPKAKPTGRTNSPAGATQARPSGPRHTPIIQQRALHARITIAIQAQVPISLLYPPKPNCLELAPLRPPPSEPCKVPYSPYTSVLRKNLPSQRDESVIVDRAVRAEFVALVTAFRQIHQRVPDAVEQAALLLAANETA